MTNFVLSLHLYAYYVYYICFLNDKITRYERCRNQLFFTTHTLFIFIEQKNNSINLLCSCLSVRGNLHRSQLKNYLKFKAYVNMLRIPHTMKWMTFSIISRLCKHIKVFSIWNGTSWKSNIEAQKYLELLLVQLRNLLESIFRFFSKYIELTLFPS